MTLPGKEPDLLEMKQTLEVTELGLNSDSACWAPCTAAGSSAAPELSELSASQQLPMSDRLSPAPLAVWPVTGTRA